MSNETLQKCVEKPNNPLALTLTIELIPKFHRNLLTDLTISKIRINYVIIWLLRARLKISTLFPEWGWGVVVVVVGGGGGGAGEIIICQYNMQINQSHYLDHFPICQEANGAWYNGTLHCMRELHNQTHVTKVVKDMCDN